MRDDSVEKLCISFLVREVQNNGENKYSSPKINKNKSTLLDSINQKEIQLDSLQYGYDFGLSTLKYNNLA